MTTAQLADFEAWLATVHTVCGPMESRAAADVPFDGHVNVRRVSDFSMIEHRATVADLHWDHRHIAEISAPYCYVILQLGAGRLSVTQQSGRATLTRGDWTIVDSLRPAAFRFDGAMHILALNLPRDVVTRWSRGQDVPCATLAAGDSGASAVFSSYACALFEHAPTLNPDDLRHRESALDLLFAALPGKFESEPRNRERQLQRVMRHVESRLADPELSPQTVARALGISTRHLHRIFRENGVSLSEWILQRRLQRARCDLADERFRGNAVFEIASTWGFKNSAHFSRAFHARFGIAPRDYRSQVQGARQLRPPCVDRDEGWR